MILRKFFWNRFNRIQATVKSDKCAGRPLMESLEVRRLLATSTYAVPAGHSLVYLEKVSSVPGEVKVFLDATSGAADYTFLVTDVETDIDEIYSSTSGLTLIDEVPAAFKPKGGIFFQSGAGSTLEVHAGVDDRSMSLGDSLLNSGTIDVYDSPSTDHGIDNYGAGVSKVILRTNDSVVSSATDGMIVSVGNLNGGTHLFVDTGLGTYDSVILGGNEDGSVNNTVVHTGAGHDAVLVTAFDPDLDVDGAASALVDFDPGSGLGAGNTLHVGRGGTVTLQQSADSSSHGIVLDSAQVDVQGSLIVHDRSTIGQITLDAGYYIGLTPIPAGEASIDAASTVITTLTNNGIVDVTAAVTIAHINGSGTTEFTGASGSSTVGDINAPSGTLKVDSGATVTVTTATVGTPAGSTIGTLTGSGTIEFTSTSGSSTIGTVNAVSGTLQVDAGAKVSITGASTVGTLTGAGLTEFTDTSGASTVQTINASSGTVQVDAFASLAVHNASTVGNLTGDGAFEFLSTSGTSTIGKITAAGTVGVDGGATINVNHTSSLNTFNITGTANINGLAHLTVFTQTNINDVEP